MGFIRKKKKDRCGYAGCGKPVDDPIHREDVWEVSPGDMRRLLAVVDLTPEGVEMVRRCPTCHKNALALGLVDSTEGVV